MDLSNIPSYVWFIVAGVILVLVVIGFFADRKNSKEKKVKKEKTVEREEQVVENIPEPTLTEPVVEPQPFAFEEQMANAQVPPVPPVPPVPVVNEEMPMSEEQPQVEEVAEVVENNISFAVPTPVVENTPDKESEIAVEELPKDIFTPVAPVATEEAVNENVDPTLYQPIGDTPVTGFQELDAPNDQEVK